MPLSAALAGAFTESCTSMPLLGEAPKSMLDMLAYAEKMQWVESAEFFIGARKLRNLLVHEYMTDTELFLQALLSAREAAEMLFRTVAAIDGEAAAIGLHGKP